MDNEIRPAANPTASWVHVLAVLKGAQEAGKDSFAHFGSLLGFDQHVRAARELGLVRDLCIDAEPGDPGPDDRDDDIVLTPAGVQFYAAFHLDKLPEGRANYWPLNAEDLVAAAAADLEQRWRARRPSTDTGSSQ